MGFRKATEVDVLIVGAGMAGLAAAATLQDDNYTVKVLEATDHIGGRIETVKLQNGAVVDNGAHWVHPKEGNPYANPVSDVVREDRLPVASIDPAKKQHFLGGKPIGAQKVQGFLDQVQARLEAQGTSRHDMKHMSVYEAIARTFPMLQQFGQKATATYNAGSPEDVGFLDISEDLYGSGGITLKGGMQALVDSFADYVGYNNILTGRAVTRITNNGDGVYVRTAKGEVFHAKHVIYTGSVATLKNNMVRFDPVFPPSLRDKLANLEMGHLCKAVFQIDPAFAKAHPELAHMRLDEHSPDLPMIVHVMGANQPVLTVIVGAEHAKKMEQMDEADVDALLRKTLAKYDSLKPILPHVLPAHPHITRWGDKDYIGGAYSFLCPGAERTGPHAVWNGRVMLAGEAFDTDAPGAVPGAMNSGIEAAKEVMFAMEKPRKRVTAAQLETTPRVKQR